MELIRNFSIIAHIDHGKSTLADRLLEYTHTIDKRQMREQVLDTMDLERERGITIKAHPIRMEYKAWDEKVYTLNLIDTPGHVDFTYEVSRSLEATEGVVLLIDASQGVEAQTLAHTLLARSLNKTIIPVINKIDLPSVDIPLVKKQMEEILGLNPNKSILASGKEGIGIEELLESVVDEISPPKGDPTKPLKALIFDSWFDVYRGVIMYIRVFDGQLKPGMEIKLMSNNRTYTATEIGVLKLDLIPRDKLQAGEVGYIIAGIKNLVDVKIGDTVTTVYFSAKEALPGYRELKPMVFCSFYPGANSSFPELQNAVEKLRLNDASWVYEPESSAALGFGYRCGFLGLLHMEIISERLYREYQLDLISTAPSVPYRITKKNGQVVIVDTPIQFPNIAEITLAEEPYIKATVLVPDEYVGGVLKLLQLKRGIQKSLNYLEGNRVIVIYELPLAEVLFDFYDKLKSASRGYASLDYELIDYRPLKLVKVDILLASEIVDALSFLVPYERAYQRGRDLVVKLKEVIPRQQFAVAIQAAIGGKVIARETIPALKKDVTAKCYGGDITRKRKLWEKQKEGKSKRKEFSKVNLPKEAFHAILKIE
ncbi:MAG: translation elongation factor 4 [bacterium]|nr:translation elongation factor 4 [bacterium]